MSANEPGVEVPERRPRVCLSLSGGGHRAALFGLGPMLYLVDEGRARDLASVSSVSGGSFTNAFAGLHVDLSRVDGATFRTEMQPLARAVSTTGTVWAQPFTKLYLAAMVAVLVAASWACFPLEGWWPVLVWAAALLVVGWMARKRSWVARQAFEKSMFHGAQLEEMNAEVDHVITACDLQTMEQAYFSGRFVNDFRHGWGVPGGLTVAQAVQASSCLPGAFAPTGWTVRRHQFGHARPEAPRRYVLVDGGVYDNMATEWPIQLRERVTTAGAPSPSPILPEQLIVVNSSAAQGVVERGSTRLPLIGEITSVLADKDVLYDQTTAVRRRLLLLLFERTRDRRRTAVPIEPGVDLDGIFVQINRSPFELPTKFARGRDQQALRARAALQLLGDTEAEWADEAVKNSSVTTALSKIPADRAARLVRHSYVLTMVNAHVLLGYDLLPVPDLEELRRWLA